MTAGWNSIEEIVGSALCLSRPVLGERPTTTALPADLPLVECDPVMIERVLVNLLENVARYTPAGTAVEIGARSGERETTIEVRDHGPGLPPGQESAIFEKFTRGIRESSTGGFGLGLGLAICRTIVEAHGSTIRACDRSGGGAGFAFTLPLGEPPAMPSEDELAAGG